jgi:hypothetical protein
LGGTVAVAIFFLNVLDSDNYNIQLHSQMADVNTTAMKQKKFFGTKFDWEVFVLFKLLKLPTATMCTL